ncbi:MAG: hypothetical protein RJA05_455, partial [Planctomycetota bacterium]
MPVPDASRDVRPTGPRDSAGDQIGSFKLISKLGEGGFGTVWLAERREPFVQQVALKIVKLGMDSASVVARFEQERQALAVFEEPSLLKRTHRKAPPRRRERRVRSHQRRRRFARPAMPSSAIAPGA